MYDLMGLRAGERIDEHFEDQLRRSLYYEHQLNSLAHRSVAIENDAVMVEARPSHRAQRKNRPQAEILEEAIKLRGAELTEKLDRFEELAKQLNDLVGVQAEFYSHYSVYKRLRSAIAKLPTLREQESTSALYDSLVQVCEAARKEVHKANHLHFRETSKERQDKVSGKTTAPVTRQSMQEAREQLSVDQSTAAPMPGSSRDALLVRHSPFDPEAGPSRSGSSILRPASSAQ